MRLLVIEDNHKIANVVRNVLAAESFAVDVCYDGEDGYNVALNDDYDLIILDRMLPGGMDGTDICRALREVGKHVPILMLTAKDQVRQRVEGLNAGADDYLVKPFSFDELLARINALLRRPHDSLDTILTVTDLTLDTASKQVHRKSQPIKLSAKEYALLEYLMRHPRQIVKKDQIIKHVWDYDSDVLPNSVEVYIKHLRDKVDKGYSQKLIRTIRGFGYMIGETINV